MYGFRVSDNNKDQNKDEKNKESIFSDREFFEHLLDLYQNLNSAVEYEFLTTIYNLQLKVYSNDTLIQREYVKNKLEEFVIFISKQNPSVNKYSTLVKNFSLLLKVQKNYKDGKILI